MIPVTGKTKAATVAAAETLPTTEPVGKSKTRIAPVIVGISTAVTMPVNRSASRGSKSLYDFDALEVGQSIAIKNKTFKS